MVDHTRLQGFEADSVRNAGLGLLSRRGRLLDQFRDQLMFQARNERLEPVGFVGMALPVQYAPSPATRVHRSSGGLVGIAEQLDLLSEGAAPVLVDYPLDAIAIARISRLTMARRAVDPSSARASLTRN